MKFEDLQKAWNSQPDNARVTVSSELLLKEVRRNQRQFYTTILWRDIREVGVAFLLVPYFLYCGWRFHDWTQLLISLACLGVGSFMIIDRLLQRKKQPDAGDSLKNCIAASLLQLHHQIWLLKNIFWWYLLPIAATLILSDVHHAWQKQSFLVTDLASDFFWKALIFGGVYWLNQYVVKKDFEPRRQELESLRSSLEGL